jgi:hypothetical protein
MISAGPCCCASCSWSPRTWVTHQAYGLPHLGAFPAGAITCSSCYELLLTVLRPQPATAASSLCVLPGRRLDMAIHSPGSSWLVIVLLYLFVGYGYVFHVVGQPVVTGSDRPRRETRPRGLDAAATTASFKAGYSGNERCKGAYYSYGSGKCGELTLNSSSCEAQCSQGRCS